MLLEPLETPEPSRWRLRIDLRGTDAAGAAPRRLHLRAIDGPWLRCTIHPQRFEGEGADVEELIGVFRRWVDARPPARPSLEEAASAV